MSVFPAFSSLFITLATILLPVIITDTFGFWPGVLVAVILAAIVSYSIIVVGDE